MAAKTSLTKFPSNNNKKGCPPPPSSKKTLFQQSLDAAFKGGFAGCLAMALQVILFMWLRTVVNYQYTQPDLSMVQAMQDLWEQGGLPRFYRGLWVALITAPLTRFGDTAANEGIKLLLGGGGGTQNKIPLFAVTFLASLAASGWRMFLTPLTNLKINLQVHGSLEGFLIKIAANPLRLWDGAVGSMLAGIVGHYPWFVVNNWLEALLPKASTNNSGKKKARSALIGLACSIASDSVSNFLRVINAVKQTSTNSSSYTSIAYGILQESGWIGLFTRGLKTKMLVNTLQSMVFALLWKSIMEYLNKKDKDNNNSARKPTFSFSTRSKILQAFVGGSVFCSVFVTGAKLRGTSSGNTQVANQGVPELHQPRIALVLSLSRKCNNKNDPTQCSFVNYGDQLMYHTALQQCQTLNADCRLAPEGAYVANSPKLRAFAKEFQPHAVWYVLGFAFGDKFPDHRHDSAANQLRFWRAQGVQHLALLPQAVGPFQKNPTKALQFFQQFDYRAVRESPSYQALKGLDPNMQVDLIQDTVFSRRLEEEQTQPMTFATNTTPCLPTLEQRQDRPLIGISLSAKMYKEIGKHKYNKEVTALLPILAQNATLILLPHEFKGRGRGDDVAKIREYYQKATQQLGVPKDQIFSCDLQPTEVSTLERTIAGLDLLVVMRYHTMVVALREGIPTAAYSWAPKYEELLKYSGIGEGGLLGFGDATESVPKIWNIYDHKEEMVPKIQEFRERTRATIDEMFANLVAEASKKQPNNKPAPAKPAAPLMATRELAYPINANPIVTPATNTARSPPARVSPPKIADDYKKAKDAKEEGETAAAKPDASEPAQPAEPTTEEKTAARAAEEPKKEQPDNTASTVVAVDKTVVTDDSTASTTAVAVVQDNSSEWRTKTTCLELENEPDSEIPEPLLSRGRCRGSLVDVPSFSKGFSPFEAFSRQHGTAGHPNDVKEVNAIKNYDAERFSKYVANEKKKAADLTHDNLVALVLKYQHQVEKGLAMPPELQRLHFGVGSGVFSKLSKFGGVYMKRYGAKQSQFIFEGLGATIDQYVQLHESKGEKVAQDVTNLRQLLTSNGVEWKEKDGGIGSVNKDTLHEFAQKDFQSLVYARRSIRQYQPRLSDDSEEYAAFRSEVYDAIRLAAEGTPSVCNRQGVKVALLRDKATIQKASAIQGGSRGHDIPEYMIMIQTNLQIFRESRERNQAYVDGGLFAMSLMYALQSKGLATCSLNFSASESKDRAMRKLLNVDDSHVIVMFLAVGRLRDDVVYTVSPRRSSHDIQAIVREI